MTTWKISMHAHGKIWNVMDTYSGLEEQAVAILNSYRLGLPRKTFRLEKHTMEVVDV